MKIAHINYIPYDNVVGVEKKLKEQATVAFELGLNIDFIILNSTINKVDRNLKLVKLNSSRNNFFSKIQKKLFKFHLIKNSINLDNYDYIILRYPNMDFSALSFSKKYGHKLITEHHTNEIGEMKSSQQSIMIRIKLFLETFLAPKFLKNIKGIITVTDEIRKIELSKINKVIPSCVVSNGINVDNIEFTKFQNFNEKELNIIFVASYFAPWHGLDMLLKGFENYNGEIGVKIYLIGDLSQKYISFIESLDNSKINIQILGRQYGKELKSYFEQSNIAVSSLSLHRNNMNEACVLKTREYLARGIPFVYGYDDSDLKGDEVFALKIDNCKDYIEIKHLINFAKKMNEIEDISSIEREYAKNNVDWKIKINQMYKFIKSLDV